MGDRGQTGQPQGTVSSRPAWAIQQTLSGSTRHVCKGISRYVSRKLYRKKRQASACQSHLKHNEMKILGSSGAGRAGQDSLWQ